MDATGAKGEGSASAARAGAVRTGVPRAHDGRSNRALIQIPFHYSGNSWPGKVKPHLVISPKDCQFSSQKLYLCLEYVVTSIFDCFFASQGLQKAGRGPMHGPKCLEFQEEVIAVVYGLII
ncbi:hypothetical protein SADUNF_Sadunf14G0083800 [Salix dunnii]|uniref:Uncharacterized protein n=1 Tax=Salix dunnii TaxID=1413687 RepID=A0A835JGE5_9ROSI|nr:hypothetical protein SADUNF_Sadunf14G0083800 [Salix dunnii]